MSAVFLCVVFKNLDLVAIGVGDEGHFFSVDKFFSPVVRPELERKAVLFKVFQHFAVGVEVVNADASMDEVFGELYFEVGGVGEFELVIASRDGEVGKLVTTGGFVGTAEDLKAARAAVPVNGLFEIGDPNASVVKLYSHTRTCDASDTHFQRSSAWANG